MSRNEIYTYFTQIGGTRLLYNSESWVRATLRLETAGQVSVGTRERLDPVLSGKGILLTTDEAETFVIPNGQRLFVAAEAVHRVKFIIEPIPWLEQILQGMGVGFNSLRSILSLMARVSTKRIVMPNERLGKPACPDRLKHLEDI